VSYKFLIEVYLVEINLSFLELNLTPSTTQKITDNESIRSKEMTWYCDRGIAIHRLMNSSELVCLCPPGYYGRLCQYQNQRVSLTLKLKVFLKWHITRIVVVTLRNDEDDKIESHEQFYYYHSHDCAKKFNIHLLYSSRPKNPSKTFTVRIDIYNEDKLEHHASWSFPIQFPFLPVYRMAVQLEVPTQKVIAKEVLNCGVHGHCSEYVNNNISYCHCNEGWTGIHCDIQYKCNCSPDSICVGPNICLCPLGKLGPRCYFKFRICPCQNGGSCMQNVKHMYQDDSFYCICPKGYYGLTCEKNATEIIISFASTLEIPLSTNVHFIQVFDATNPHEQTTIFTRIPVDQDIVTIYRSDPFHIKFVEVLLPKTYYLTFFQPEYKSIILGYQIRQFVSFSQQSLPIKILTAIVTFMLACGLISGILSILTFQTKKVRQVACGYYLLISSYTSIILIIIFSLKFCFLIVFQMGFRTDRNYLSFNCKIMDFFLKIFLNSVDWLNACVGIERAMEAINEKKSNRNKSKRSPKWIISSIFIFIALSHIQDPIYRRLIDDEEDKRTWCILEFSSFLRTWNSVILMLHIIIPFIMNITSALIVIINIARRRSAIQKQHPYKEHLRQQFYKFKHLLVSPLVLIILGSPQLAISFMSRCLKSFRNPWLFVTGYFISFIPPMLIFFIFVLPSTTYKNEFGETIERIKRRMRRH
jgi:hypothetical protein